MKKEKVEIRDFGKMTEEEALALILEEGYVNLKKGTMIGFIKKFHEDDKDWFANAYIFKKMYKTITDDKTKKKERKEIGESKVATFDAPTARKLFWEKYDLKAKKKNEKPLSPKEAMDLDWN